MNKKKQLSDEKDIEVAANKIYKTKDYDKFIFKKDNRSRITNRHVDAIISSISSKNLLELKPILVNEKMEIIDGQHRFLAAKKLGLEVYYTIDENSSFEDVIFLNVSKSWKTEDYLNFFCKNNYEHYVNFKNFIDKNELALSIALRVCVRVKDHKSVNDFKSGKFIFKIDDLNGNIFICQKIVSFINKEKGHSEFTRSVRFWHALSKVVQSTDFNFDKFMSNLSKMIEKISIRATIDGYVRMFEDIHNWRNEKKISVFEWTKE
ncbi:MAG: ParB/Srx family N-terminal domain-containing protein [Nanoarchaeota archaeon]